MDVTSVNKSNKDTECPGRVLSHVQLGRLWSREELQAGRESLGVLFDQVSIDREYSLAIFWSDHDGDRVGAQPDL